MYPHKERRHNPGFGFQLAGYIKVKRYSGSERDDKYKSRMEVQERSKRKVMVSLKVLYD